MRKWTYLLHRWIGLIVSVQLLAWSIGGLLFSVMDIESVRGEHHASPVSTASLREMGELVSVDSAMLSAAEGGVDVSGVRSATLRDRGLGWRWELEGADGVAACVDAKNGALLGHISPGDARAVAEAGFSPECSASSVTLIERDPPIEARGKRLPVYQVVMDHPTRARLYVDAMTGEIVGRRNRMWRVFDFFWMLHVMDYTERDRFNHPLLTIAASLAVLSAGSGLSLWGWRAGTRVRRRAGIRALRHGP